MSIEAMIDAVMDSKPSEFNDAFKDVMAERSVEALAARKLSVAQTMFQTAVEPEVDAPTE